MTTPLGRLVLLCAKTDLTDPSDETKEELRELLSDPGMPWQHVFVVLTGQGLSLIFRNLIRQTGCEEAVPDDVRAALDMQHRRNVYEMLFSEAALRRVASRCAEAGIELIVLKGLHLSSVVYPVHDIRLTGDIDFLVRREDAEAFRELLGTMGYREYNLPVNLFWERRAECLSFKAGESPSVSLDVHTLFVPERRFRKWQATESIESIVWLQSSPSPWMGASVREMRPEHLIIYLCLHATVRHTFARMLWLVDLREVLRHYADVLDLGVLCGFAEEWHMRTFVYLALLAAQKYAGADVPEELMVRLRPGYRGVERFEALLESGSAVNTLVETPVPVAQDQMARLRDTRMSRAAAAVALPYHEARRAFRHWGPWVAIKDRFAHRSARRPASPANANPSTGSTTLVHVLWSGGVGGAERAVYQLAREQLRAGALDVSVALGTAVGPYVDRFAESGCGIVDGGFRWGGDLRGVLRLSKALRPFEVHHFHVAQPAMVVASLLSGRKVRVYTHRGGSFERGMRRRVRDVAMGVMLRRGFDAYSGNTRHAATVAAARYGIPAGRFSVTYNGLEFGLLGGEIERDELRAELGIPADAVVVGTSANLRRIKRIDWLIEAAAPLGDDHVWLLVLGDGPARRDLETQAASLGLGDRIVFTGLIERVGDYLRAMDVFVLPTGQEESFGNAAVEAMGMGVPTAVFSDGGGLVEHIQDGVSGFIVDDIHGLTALLRDLSRDADLRDAIGSAGAEAVRSRYTPDASAESYLRLYAEALRHSGRSSSESLGTFGTTRSDAGTRLDLVSGRADRHA